MLTAPARALVTHFESALATAQGKLCVDETKDREALLTTMNRIFISHSSKDALQAEQILGWLKAEKIGAFLDSDLEFGIKAGADWNEELRKRLDDCIILIPVCSHNFRASDWCRYEVDVAYHRSIDIIPILIDESDPITILQRFQTITLGKNNEEGRQRLLAGIKRILDSEDPVHWDPQRRPYPGLDPFLEADEAIFFGRQREINESIQMLRSLRREKEAALLMVIGASGSGKSSLVRAGILPRIKRDPEEWIVLDPFRPGQEPFRELATCFASLFESLGKTLNWSDVMAKLQASPLETLSEMSTDLRMLTKKKEATLLICIDQFEEALEISTSEAYSTTTDQRKEFINALKTVINSQAYRDRLLIVGTLRSDFLDVFQIQGMKYKEYILRPLEEENFRQVIVEPARIIGLKIEPELVDTMINDTKTGDALPLLAFTLRELWERKRENKPVGLESAILKQRDYIEIGRLEGAIQKRAEDQFPQNCSISEEGIYRDAFLRMIRSNADMDHFGWVRQAATWEEMPPESLGTLDRFVTARLLVKKTYDEQILIEPAHEALLRNWARLRQWIKEENDFLLWRDRFYSDFLQWRDSTARSKEYLSGAKLIEAERWKDKYSLASQERIFIEKSILHRRRNKQLRISAVLTLIAFLLASLNLWQNAEEAQAEQLKIRQLTTIDTDPYESGIAGLAAMGRFFLRPGLNYQIARGLDRALTRNLARAEKLGTSLSRIDAITQLSDNRLIVAGIQGAEAYLLEITINSEGVMSEASKPKASKQTTIRQLLPTNDGKATLSLGYSDSQALLTTWPKQEQQEIFKSLQIDRQTLAFIPGPDLVIAAYGESDGMLYLWSAGTDVEKVSGSPRTKAFTTLADGTIVSAHESGPLRKWQIIRRDGKIQLNSLGTLNPSGSDSAIISLASFASKGKTVIIAGGEDGSMRLWMDDKEIQRIEPQVTGHNQIHSLAALPGGDVVSGDNQSMVRWWKWDQTEGKGGMLRPLTDQPFATGQEAINRLTVLAGTKQANLGVISTGADGSLRLLFPPPRNFTNPWPHSTEAPKATFTALTELESENLVASAHENGTICWWSIPTSWQNLDDPECKRLPGSSRAKGLVGLPRKGQLISAGSDGNHGMLFSWNKGRKDSLLTTTEGTAPVSPINAMIAAKNGVLITGHQDGTLRWWTLQDEGSSEGLGPAGFQHSGLQPVNQLLSLAGNRFVSAGGPAGEERLRWWKGSTPLSPQVVTIPHDRLTSMVRWKGNQVITGGYEGSLQLWSNGKREGPAVKTSHNTQVWSLLKLRGNLLHGPVLLTGGEQGNIRIWTSEIRNAGPDSQADHESLNTGQSRIVAMLENKAGDLISAADDGSLKVISPRNVVQAACQQYQPQLKRPTNISEREAAQLCSCQIPQHWWNLFGWFCFGWNLIG